MQCPDSSADQASYCSFSNKAQRLIKTGMTFSLSALICFAYMGIR